MDSKAGLDEEMWHTVSQRDVSPLLLWWLVPWAEMVWLSHIYVCRVVVLQFFSVKGQISNCLKIVNIAFSTALKMGCEEAEAEEGWVSVYTLQGTDLEKFLCIPGETWGETKHWKKALSIREQKGKDKHPGWQTLSEREEGDRTVTNDDEGEWWKSKGQCSGCTAM